MRITQSLWATLLVSILPNFAMAESFHCISNSSHCTAAQNLSWSLSGNSLTIRNNSVDGSFISVVSFDYGPAMGVIRVSDWQGSAVSFRKEKTQGASILSGASAAGQASHASWIVNGESYRARQDNGVGSTESITFELTGVSAKNFSNGTMRVGVHLEGLADTTGTAASISLATVAMPEPAIHPRLLSRLVASLGLMGDVVWRRLSTKNT